jgi:hypothetical protein
MGVLAAVIGAASFGALWALAYRFLVGPWWTRRASVALEVPLFVAGLRVSRSRHS